MPSSDGSEGTASAGREGTEKFVLDSLPLAQARDMRVALLHRAEPPSEDSGSDETPPGTLEDVVLLRFDRRWVRYAPLTSSGNVIAAGLLAVLGQFGDALGERVFDEDLSADPESGLLSFVPPSDLVHRLKALPPEYVREQGLRDRLKVTFNRRLADSSLTRARASATSSWPDISLLTDLHPVMEWLTDKVLVRLDRQEAPVLQAEEERNGGRPLARDAAEKGGSSRPRH